MSANKVAHNRLDLTGKKFSGWLVVSFNGVIEYGERGLKSRWLCQCDCGKMSVVNGSSLTTGNSKSCGCVNRLNMAKKNKTHGLSGTDHYRRWQGMLNRCGNENSASYKNYGGRGITVCERWLTYTNFISDMGYPPTSLHSLERINNNADYQPSNCKWATRSEQSKNKRSNRIISFNGITKTLKEWALEIGIDQSSLRERLEKWSIKDALSKPKRKSA